MLTRHLKKVSCHAMSSIKVDGQTRSIRKTGFYCNSLIDLSCKDFFQEQKCTHPLTCLLSVSYQMSNRHHLPWETPWPSSPEQGGSTDISIVICCGSTCGWVSFTPIEHETENTSWSSLSVCVTDFGFFQIFKQHESLLERVHVPHGSCAVELCYNGRSQTTAAFH